MNNRLRTLIIEDETLARNRLKRLLTPYESKIEIIGEASNGKMGLEMIEELKPDFIFLDIQMPLLNGFEMLSHLSFQPYIVFTTAYDQYALKAFEENSIDFLLKPIKEERIKITIDKIVGFQDIGRNDQVELQKIQDLIAYLQKPEPIKSISVTIGDRIVIVDLDDIVYFKAEDKLTTIVTVDKKYLFDPSLKQLEEKLPERFLRLNRSHIVNKKHVAEIRKGGKGKLIFEMNTKEKTKIVSSSNYGAAIRQTWKF